MTPGVRPTFFKDTLLTAAAPAIWGSTYLVAAELLPQDRPLTAAAIRTVPAGLALVVAMGFGSFRSSPGRLLVLAIINISAFQALLFIAAERLPGGIAAMVGALSLINPMTALMMGWILVGPGPTSTAVAGVIIVLLSISVLQQTGTRAGTPPATPHAHSDRLPPYHPNFLKP